MICDRCKKEIAAWKMSWFNTQNICLQCHDEENNHELIVHAKEIVKFHEQHGERNFKGVGLPIDLQRKYNCEAHKDSTILTETTKKEK